MVSGKIFFNLAIFFLLFLTQFSCSQGNNDSIRENQESTINIKDDTIQDIKKDEVADEEVPEPAPEVPVQENTSMTQFFMQVKNLLIFHTKDTMKLDSTYSATLALGKNISLDELADKIKKVLEPGGKIKITDTTLEIGLQMSATLEDKASEKDPNFSIRPVGSASNIRVYDAKKNKMVWQWNVTPLKEGQHQLSLSISLVDKNGIASNPETQWYSITIYSEKKKGSPGNGFGSFLSKNWQWLISAIIIPVFLAWFTTRQRRKNEQANLLQADDKTNNRNLKRKKR
jgi:hypothetical protein